MATTTEPLNEDFYWMISRLKNFEPNTLMIWLGVLKKYEGQDWSGSRTQIMNDLVEAMYTDIRDLREGDDALLDKRFQSHVSFMFALGLGYENNSGMFVLSSIAKACIERKNVADFVLQQMLRWQVPNGSIRVKEKLQRWVQEGRAVIPFVLTLKVLAGLHGQSESEAYLTIDEIIRFLMPQKSHLGGVNDVVRVILERRRTGASIRLTEREGERAKEDLKILLSYFEATGLCYLPKSVLGKVGGKTVQISDALVLSLDKAELINHLLSKEYPTFDFSRFNLETQFQEAKLEWFQYYGSLPESWKGKGTLPVEPMADPPLAMPSKEDLDSAVAEIRKKLIVNDDVIRQIVMNLVAGKHVLLAGPIAGGKTHLATLVSKLVWKSFNNGYYSEVATATSEWTTQDVIGGIYPKLDQSGSIVYTIQNGWVTDTVWQNWGIMGESLVRVSHKRDGIDYRGVWLVIDEFNRANIDRAFGELFTALEYKTLKYPTIKNDARNDQVPIPKDYRIIATLNTFDKHFLFKLSDALKRRFAYIELLPPPREISEEEKYYIVSRGLEDLPATPELATKISLDAENRRIKRGETDEEFLKMLDSAHDMFSFIRLTKNLGTGILISMLKLVFVANLAGQSLERSLDDAFVSNVVTQLENLPKWSLESIRAFCCGNIVDLLKAKKRDQADFIYYQREFEKLMRFLPKDGIEKRVERYEKGEIDDREWENYNPWAGKSQPPLPLFRKALEDLISESEAL